MSSTLVSRHIAILRSLSQDSRGKNEIVRHTGVKWNKPILENIEDLRKAGLISEEKEKIDSKFRNKNKRKHVKKGKKQLQKLAPLGREILKIISIADGYKRSISRLKLTISEKIFFIQPEHLTILNGMEGFLSQDIMRDSNSQTIINDKEIVGILRKYEYRLKEKCGWYDREIEFYNECRVGAVNFLIFCEQYYDYILRLRYAWVLHAYSVSARAKEIISGIMLHFINESIKYDLENIKDRMVGYSTIRYYAYFPFDYLSYGFVGGMYDFFERLYHTLTDYPIPHVIHSEVKELLMIYLALLKPNEIKAVLSEEIYGLEHRHIHDQDIRKRVNERFPILYPSSPPEMQAVKTNRYQELIEENKRFVTNICEEYGESNNKEISADMKRLNPVIFSPTSSLSKYEFFHVHA